MVILGVDPGSYATGFGLIRRENQTLHCLKFGVIRPNKSLPSFERLGFIYTEILKKMDILKPDAIALEKTFFAEHPRAALALGEIRGAILSAAFSHILPVFEYTATEVKLAVVGYGKADKEQIQKMVKMLLTLPTLPAKDAADALAVAICHAHTWKPSSLAKSLEGSA